MILVAPPRSDGLDRAVCIHELFEGQAADRPEATALICRHERMAYGDLDSRANQLAHALLARGVGPDRYVAVLLERSFDLIVAVLGTLKAGAAYLLIDPFQSVTRSRAILERSDARTLITRAGALPVQVPSGLDVLDLDREGPHIAAQSTDRPVTAVTPEHLAYITYTSGSTGEPKGIEVPHRTIAGFICGISYAVYDTAQVTLQHSSVCWDAFTLELWPALARGGACVLYPGRVITPADLQEAIERDGVTTVWLTASLFASIVDSNATVLANLRQLLVGGEAVSVSHARRALSLLPDTRLVNGYGPSECTVFSACYVVPRELPEHVRSLPIGAAVGDRVIHLLDARMQPVAPGGVGEIYIGGPGVSRGYRGDRALTASSFVPDAFGGVPGARLYKSGDLGLVNAAGELEFVGRTDHQVKLRGYRVELGEIEAALGRHDGVRECAVILREDRPNEKHLVAYVVVAGPEVGPGDLRRHLKIELPDYMVPTQFMVLPRLPLNDHGKLDRRALPAPTGSLRNEACVFVAPRTPIEHKLAEICADLLGVPALGVNDDFFEVGGHSLLANLVVLKTREAFSVDISLRRFFECPTVAGWATAVEAMLVPAERP